MSLLEEFDKSIKIRDNLNSNNLIPEQICNENFRFLILQNSKKSPIEEEWQSKNNYKYNDKKLLEHLQNGGNYGIIGGFGDLIIIDFDDEEIENKIINKLPKTFTVKSAGKGRQHRYYYIDMAKSFKLIEELEKTEDGKTKNKTLVDFQGNGKYVVAPNSKLENNKIYEVIDNSKITHICKLDLTTIFEEVCTDKIHFGGIQTLVKFKEYDENDIHYQIKQKLKMSYILGKLGFDITRNPTECLLHQSKGKKDLGYNDNLRGGWYNCFGCGKTGDIFNLVQNKLNYNHTQALKYLAELADIEVTDVLDDIEIPHKGKSISRFSDEMCDIFLKRKAKIFFQIHIKQIVELYLIKDKINKEETISFSVVKPNRFINIIEEHSSPISFKDNKGIRVPLESSIKSADASAILENECWKNRLRKIEKIFTIPIPILYNNELTFPKKGHDERFNSWLPINSPKIDEKMNIIVAINIIKNIYKEFCFKNEQSRINAYAHLFTEFCQGLYGKFTTRTPIFFWEGNRERVGKDYGAKVTALVFEGMATEDPAISTDSKLGNNTDELRKNLTSSLINGKRRFHSANNRGYINNVIIEQIVTSEYWKDRILGKSEIVELPNYLFFSMSANTGYTITSDLANRCRYIRLHYDKEDANSRIFINPYLHQWVIENRSDIISALYACVKEWYNAGMPKSESPFASFPKWAEVVGGIMIYNKLGNPCAKEEDDDYIHADAETEDVKTLFELIYEKYPNCIMTKNSIKNFIINDKMVFCGLIFKTQKGEENRSASIKFSFIIEKYVNRLFSDIRLIKKDINKRKHLETFVFRKECDEHPIKKVDIQEEQIDEFKNNIM